MFSTIPLLCFMAYLPTCSSYKVTRMVFPGFKRGINVIEQGGRPITPRLRELSMSTDPNEYPPDNAIKNLAEIEYERYLSGEYLKDEIVDFVSPTVDIYGDTDDEVLENMRIKRQLDNDMWQSCMFRNEQCGSWDGEYELYIPSQPYQLAEKEKKFELTRVTSGSVASKMSASEYTVTGVNISVSEEYTPFPTSSSSVTPSVDENLKVLLTATRPLFLSTEFRTNEGNQGVGNVYTLCGDMSEDTAAPVSRYIAEIGIKEESLRARVRYLYSSDSSMAEGLLSLQGLVVIKETEINNSTLQDVMRLHDKTLGEAIYDPQRSGEPYIEYKFPGKLTLFFPRFLSLEPTSPVEPNTLTMQWEGRTMRFQADRKFLSPSGAIKTLELTEIRAEDTIQYPAGFTPSPQLLK